MSSKSCIVFNQPASRKYTVYISDSLTNQTITEIENDIVGTDDALEDRYDTGEDQVRKLEVENTQVLFVKKSLERGSRMLASSLVVVVKNETETAAAGANRYSVWRYWRSLSRENSWIQKEHLFISGTHSDFYEDFDLFDDYAIGFRDNKFYVIYWKGYRGEEVPSNFERKAYDQAYEEEDSSVAAYSFYDRSGYNGEYELMIWVRTAAAIQLRPVIMLIEPESYN